jgi:hypothetical protein
MFLILLLLLAAKLLLNRRLQDPRLYRPNQFTSYAICVTSEKGGSNTFQRRNATILLHITPSP